MRAIVVAVTSTSLLVAALLHARAVSALVAPVLSPPPESLLAPAASAPLPSSLPRIPVRLTGAGKTMQLDVIVR